MVFLEAALVIGVVCVLVFGTIRLLTPTDRPRLAAPPWRWQTAHRDVKGETWGVLQKVYGSGSLLEEHLVATIPVDDAEYDVRFLAAMAAARERQALLEAEEG